MMDGNDIWEALFGIFEGNVPDAMTEDFCDQLAEAINVAQSHNPDQPPA